jgi:Flp pilus assembly protein CpaB
MNVMRLRIAFMGLMLALLFGYGLCRMWQSRAQRRARLEPDVLFAAHDLRMGTVIKDEDVQVGSRPGAPSGCILAKAQVIGRTVLMPLLKGTMVCSSDVRPIEEASFAGPNMRALWVPISRVVGAIPLQSGSRVDLSVPGTPGTTTAEHTAMLKNILVLAVDQERNGKSEGKDLIVPVALMVSPDAALKLKAAGLHAQFQLSTRKAAETK